MLNLESEDYSVTDTIDTVTSENEGRSGKALCMDSQPYPIAFQKDDAHMQDEQPVCNGQKVSELILHCHMRPSLTIDSMKRWGKKIVGLTRASGGNIKLNAAHDLIANALGYKSYLRANQLRGEDDGVPNLWQAEGSCGLHLLTINGGWPSEKPSEEFNQRRAFNKKRAFASMQDKIERRRLKNIERHLRQSGGYPRP
ncbi:hypothetical protein [Pseudomonas sp. BP01]|uniref:hypothetical protein n=1 Tax=Pseudomonas sp. BP01 TaxID=2976152 RepID=UPI001FAAE01A|nr:hypothetical protein [Pseudomonas sp. BP01]